MSTISEIFINHFFEIPKFQRMFAWENKEIEDLFNDIFRISNHSNYRHHLGYITLFDLQKTVTTENNQLKHVFVIDGQQRITALMLLVASFIHRTNNMERLNEVRKELREVVFINILGRGKSPRLRIQDIPKGLPFYHNMPDFYNNLLTNINFNRNYECVIPAQRKLLNAISIFDEKLRNITSEDKLSALGNTLLKRIEINENIHQTYREAGNIFEGLNNRGKKISELEKLKSYFIFCFQGEGFEDNQEWFEFVNTKFAEIYYYLEAADLANDKIECDLINAHFSAIESGIRDFDVTQARLPGIQKIRTADDIKAYINLDVAFNKEATKNLRQAIEYYLNTLSITAEFYVDIRRPLRIKSFECINNTSNNIKDIKSISDYLVKLENSITIAPMLVSFYLKFKGSKEFTIYYLRLLSLLERVLFRYVFIHQQRIEKVYFYRRASSISIEKNAKDIKSVTSEICKEIANLFYNNDYHDLTHEGFEKTLGKDPAYAADNRTYYPYLIYSWLTYKGYDVSFDTIKRNINEGNNDRRNYLTIIPPVGALNGRNIPIPFQVLNAPARRIWHRDFSNIFITNSALNEFDSNDFDRLNYAGRQGKRIKMLELNVIERDEIPKAWSLECSERRRKEMVDWALKRWSIPENGWI